MRRIITVCLALIALGLATTFLYGSWSQPPPQTKLDLAQTNLALEAVTVLDNPDYSSIAAPLLDSEGISVATQRYEEAIAASASRLATTPPAARSSGQQTSLDELRLRDGLLLAKEEKLVQAQDSWKAIQSETLQPVAGTLDAVFSGELSQIAPNAEQLIQEELDGWFEFFALQNLYERQQRLDVLQVLETQQEDVAVGALNRLLVLAGGPLLGALVGLILLVVWGIGMVLGKWPALGERWSVPWDIETTVVVMSVWFIAYLLVGLFVPGILVSLLGASPRDLGYVQQAIALAVTYAAGAAVGFFMVFSTARSYLQRSSAPNLDVSPNLNAPNLDAASLDKVSLEKAGVNLEDASDSPSPSSVKTGDGTDGEPIFRTQLSGKWPLWGVGGYFAALPLVVLAGIIAQQLLPQSGGGNPILPIILESQGWVPGGIFLLVVSVMAPLFEETLFRGFLLPSLTRVMPVWGAIAISAVLFAVVHLNVSDLLPLTTLGIVLGVVYSRSRNLLAPMLLHSCWNAGSFAALTLLSSGN
ncbi:MAG: CPBP family intramembrane glutamic endopeptidase [Cyanobacteria bacterium P01_A01_bin.3]